MILVDEEIKKAVSSGEIGISDFSAECLQPASYDLRVGEEGFMNSANRVINIQNEGMLEIQPGDFALIMTHERLRLPANMLGRFGLRSLYARMGLLATAGPQVDPGFEGKLVIGVVNFSSQTIKLSYLTPFCSLELQRLSQNAHTPYQGPYKSQEHITDEIITTLPKEPFPLAVMLVRQLIATSPTLRTAQAPPQPRKELPKDVAVFMREKQVFDRLKSELLQTHRGEYVVIREGKAVLFGHNKSELAKQAYQQFGYGPLYIGLVQEKPEVVHIPTPKVRRGTI